MIQSRLAIPLQRITQIIDFWFGEIPTDNKFYINNQKDTKFFTKDPSFDNEISALFLEDMIQASKGHLDDWQETPQGSLALFILLDQFHRNVFRGTPQSFSADPKALQNCLYGIEKEYDKVYIPWVRLNYYLPLEHSEDLSIQLLCLEKSQQVIEECRGTPIQAHTEEFYSYAEMHKAIIQRFGRFPHRNIILGRTSTQEEIEFLTGPNSSF